jgi:hypothetical protein
MLHTRDIQLPTCENQLCARLPTNAATAVTTAVTLKKELHGPPTLVLLLDMPPHWGSQSSYPGIISPRLPTTTTTTVASSSQPGIISSLQQVVCLRLETTDRLQRRPRHLTLG